MNTQGQHDMAKRCQSFIGRATQVSPNFTYSRLAAAQAVRKAIFSCLGSPLWAS